MLPSFIMTVISYSCVVLFLDLLKNYDDIIPPTIVKKKRESERRVPVRKRTAPIDMRMSRSRISVGGPTREILAAQQLAQKVAAKVPDATIHAEAVPAAVRASPVESKTSGNESEMYEPAATERAVQDDSAPPRPSFKEPPPELDDVPPMPTFKEPPSEDDDAPGMQPPSFISPPASPPPVIEEKPQSPAVSVTPATPNHPIRGLRRNSALQSSGASPMRSPSPRTPSRPATPVEDQVLGTGPTGLSRHSSGQAAVVRGPRLSRSRPMSGVNVSSIAANFNRTSASKSPPPPNTNVKRLSGGTRPSTLTGASADGKGRLGRSAGFSRRTMASDAEDEVVGGA